MKKNEHEMLTYDHACQLIDASVARFRLSTEVVNVKQAYLRVASEDQFSKVDLPPFRKSAMDGYAILAHDIQPIYRVVDVVPAGQFSRQKLQQGLAIQVMTGAPVPDDTGQVIPLEHTEIKGDKIFVRSHQGHPHICEQGEDIKRGELILKQSTLLTPLEITHLISGGITELSVYQQPKVAIFSTGDELVDSMEQLQTGKIIDSNGPMLNLLCTQQGWKVIMNHTVPDQAPRIQAAFSEALTQADLIISSGGVSVGDFDYVAEAIRALGFMLHFDRLAIKPGKPTTFASAQNQYIFALPGNPVAVYLTFHLFVKRLVNRWMGRNASVQLEHRLLAEKWTRKDAKRLEFMLGKRLDNGTIHPITSHGSADLLALQRADGFFMVPQGVSDIAENAPIHFIPWNSL